MGQLVIVSNRLPLTFRSDEDGVSEVEMSAGGLATALRSLTHNVAVSWIGWPGSDGPLHPRDVVAASVEANCDIVPVSLSESDRTEFYCGLCNDIIWPLFHGLPVLCSFNPAQWIRYKEVNARFAQTICDHADSGDFIWVHDYHLMYLGKLLSTHFTRDQLAYFHHIPFPSPEIFARLPWKLEILASLLGFGQIGFQTAQDHRNFVACVGMLFPQAELRQTPLGTELLRGRAQTVVRTAPISIDFDEFASIAGRPQVATIVEQIREELKVRRLVLGVDRLDYTKGIPERLQAFRELLIQYPGLQKEISLLQVVVPSREEMPRYQQLKKQIELLVGAINQQFATSSWTPVHYRYGHLTREELVAHYRAADIALVTPLRDGMNLVAKEF